MISLVRGEVAVRRPDHVVVVCAGVGYQLAVSGQTLQEVPQIGESVTLHAHLVVREDALQLYGFSGDEERELFRLLIGVQSVGPKLALALLSDSSVGELLRAVGAGDTKRLCAVPGIGKRTAERIVVELREKVGGVAIDNAIATPVVGAASSLARDGLLGLGFTIQEATALLDSVEGDTPEELIEQALRASHKRDRAGVS